MLTTLLGGLSPAQFLAEYWQKKPLLIRQAIPGFQGVVDKATLFGLARAPDVESRLIRHDHTEWEVIRGPQRAVDLRGKRHPWTVLVQGVNLFVPEGDLLLHSFDFIPQARLDDLIKRLKRDLGTGIVLVTHELDSLFAVADRVLFLDVEAHTATALGPPTELRDHGPAAVREFLTRGVAETEKAAA